MNPTTLQNPLGPNASFCSLISSVLDAVTLIGVPISVLLIVYVGFKFVMAQGEPKKISEARDNLLYTIIGIVVFFGAALIGKVILGTLGQFGVNVGGCSL